MQVRAYQQDVLDEVVRANTIVVLPTGSGKTFLAVQLIKTQAPALLRAGKLAIFLAPTKTLVHQQAEVLRHHREARPNPSYLTHETSIPR